MNSLAQKDGLCLEDPLEKLRSFFRMYWLCIAKGDLEKANDVWEKSVSAELELIYQSHPEISQEGVQIVLFEEKHRVHDHTYLVESIVEKLAVHLNDLSANRPTLPFKEISQEKSIDTSKAKSHQTKASNASKETAPFELDLTAMIDSMLEEEEMLNR